MKRLFAVTLAVLALAGCDQKTASTPTMPEFYVYAGKPVCLAEVSNSDANVANRRAETFSLLSSFYEQTAGWTQKMNVVGVDYIDFKKFTLVIYAPCTDTKAVQLALDEAGAISKNFTGKVGGDAKLISDAKVVEDFPGGVNRFKHFNPDADAAACLMHYSIPAGASASAAGQIANAVVHTAMEFHFSIADFAANGSDMYFLLARDCDKQDAIATNWAEAFAKKGLVIDKIIIRQKDANYPGYAALMPVANGK